MSEEITENCERDFIHVRPPIPPPSTTHTSPPVRSVYRQRVSKVWEDRFTGSFRSSQAHIYNHIGSHKTPKRHSFAGHHVSSRYTSAESIPNNLAKTASQMGSSRSSIKEHLFTMIAPDDNKLCLKFFGTKHAVHMEQRRLFSQHTWIIHPYSCFK